MKKRVVVVGAGPCGLAALKEMCEAGHEVVLFERTNALGGLFASAAAYPNLHLTISNWAMSFSDFPDTERLCYSSAEQYLRYLHAYARHFDLERHISYGSELLDASLEADGQWLLEVRQGPRSVPLQVRADALIVATGSNQLPKDVPAALAGFRGPIIHSSQYDDAFKREVETQNLRVLVVGGGESAADISAELGDLSSNVTVWLRRANCIGPRYLNDKPEMEQIWLNKSIDFPANSFLEAATTNRMSAGQNVYAYGLFRRLLWNARIVLNPTLSRMCLKSVRHAPLMNDQATYVTKNQRMCEALHEGKIEMLVSPTVSADGQSCYFTMADGSRERRSFDAIVLCHGYHMQFPWLRVPVPLNPRAWYLHCFPPELGERLFFVGYARPHQGGIPQMAEMLSRYIALLLRGERTLPTDYALRARRDEKTEREYYFLSPELGSLVDYNSFLESVARRVGCEPGLPFSCVALVNLHLLSAWLGLLGVFGLNPLGFWPTFVTWLATLAGFFLIDDGVLIKWWFYPNWAVWYRQRGPGAQPALLKHVLGRVKLRRATAITTGFALFVSWAVIAFYVQRLLSPLLFLPNAMLARMNHRFPKAWGGFLKPKLFALHDCPWRFSDLFLP